MVNVRVTPQKKIIKKILFINRGGSYDYEKTHFEIYNSLASQRMRNHCTIT